MKSHTVIPEIFSWESISHKYLMGSAAGKRPRLKQFAAAPLEFLAAKTRLWHFPTALMQGLRKSGFKIY